MVLRADHDKGYVDLSKRRVDADDAKAKDEWFAKAKAVHGIMRHVASLHNVDTDELCKKVSWPLYAKYPDAHEAFRKHVNEEINVWSELDFSQPGEDISDKAEALKADIEIYLRRRLIAQALRLRAKVDVSCSGFEGIDAIKEALMKGFDASIEECEVKIKLIAHPMFMLTCQCTEKIIGENVLKKAIELIQKEIEAKGGEFALRMAPELVGQEEKGHDDIPSDVSSNEEGEDGPEDQDETMGDIDEQAMKDLMEKTKHLDAEDDK
jgi:translation initiation factor 2 subunit 1